MLTLEEEVFPAQLRDTTCLGLLTTEAFSGFQFLILLLDRKTVMSGMRENEASKAH